MNVKTGDKVWAVCYYDADQNLQVFCGEVPDIPDCGDWTKELFTAQLEIKLEIKGIVPRYFILQDTCDRDGRTSLDARFECAFCDSKEEAERFLEYTKKEFGKKETTK